MSQKEGRDTVPVSLCSGAREFVEDIFWIQECNPKPALKETYAQTKPVWYTLEKMPHMQQNAFLIQDEKSLIFDTTSPANRESLLPVVEDILDKDTLDYVVGSHPEAPHAGNAFALLDAFPEAEFVAPSYDETNELYGMDDALLVSPGDRLDLGTYTVEFVDPVFLDHRVHIWMRELQTNTLFTVDWLGMIHTDTECLVCADELEKPVTVSRLAEFHRRALFWLAYADPQSVATAIDNLLETYEPEIIAPAHGNPIREDVDTYAEMMKEVTERISGGTVNEAW